MKSLSPRTKQILYAVGAIAIIALVVVVGILIGNRLGGGSKPASKSVVTAAPTTGIVKATSTLAGGAASQPGQAKALTGSGERVAVPQGRVENDTSIAILPIVTLRGDRRYLLEVSSNAGALPFSGSYSRGSIDPKIAIDVKTDIKGTTPWEAEIQPPAPDARQWNLGVSLSLNPLGKNVQVQVWDIGPR